ncbi:uncharacterized protein [Littorina saxatilis]|uniref:uncharacterized protein n=1 Tax=Littorina saxatilis TaxID=31220 RepID=UPI0038B508E2
MASHNSMEEGDTAVLSDVKIEIDVAEECWHMTEPHPYVPFSEVVATENTSAMPTVSTLEGQAVDSTHSDTWVKREEPSSAKCDTRVKQEEHLSSDGDLDSECDGASIQSGTHAEPLGGLRRGPLEVEQFE